MQLFSPSLKASANKFCVKGNIQIHSPTNICSRLFRKEQEAEVIPKFYAAHSTPELLNRAASEHLSASKRLYGSGIRTNIKLLAIIYFLVKLIYNTRQEWLKIVVYQVKSATKYFFYLKKDELKKAALFRPMVHNGGLPKVLLHIVAANYTTSVLFLVSLRLLIEISWPYLVVFGCLVAEMVHCLCNFKVLKPTKNS